MENVRLECRPSSNTASASFSAAAAADDFLREIQKRQRGALQIEEDLRKCETRSSAFDDHSSSWPDVYKKNDQRAALKKKFQHPSFAPRGGYRGEDTRASRFVADVGGLFQQVRVRDDAKCVHPPSFKSYLHMHFVVLCRRMCLDLLKSRTKMKIEELAAI